MKWIQILASSVSANTTLSLRDSIISPAKGQKEQRQMMAALEMYRHLKDQEPDPCFNFRPPFSAYSRLILIPISLSAHYLLVNNECGLIRHLLQALVSGITSE